MKIVLANINPENSISHEFRIFFMSKIFTWCDNYFSIFKLEAGFKIAYCWISMENVLGCDVMNERILTIDPLILFPAASLFSASINLISYKNHVQLTSRFSRKQLLIKNKIVYLKKWVRLPAILVQLECQIVPLNSLKGSENLHLVHLLQR